MTPFLTIKPRTLLAAVPGHRPGTNLPRRITSARGAFFGAVNKRRLTSEEREHLECDSERELQYSVP